MQFEDNYLIQNSDDINFIVRKERKYFNPYQDLKSYIINIDVSSLIIFNNSRIILQIRGFKTNNIIKQF